MTLTLAFGLNLLGVPVLAQSVSSRPFGVEASEKIRFLLDSNFSHSPNAKTVFVRSVECRAQIRKSTAGEFVCTLLKSRFDASIFGGEQASELVTVLGQAGVSQDHGEKTLTLKAKNLLCKITGHYSDGSYEHTCSVDAGMATPVASSAY